MGQNVISGVAYHVYRWNEIKEVLIFLQERGLKPLTQYSNLFRAIVSQVPPSDEQVKDDLTEHRKSLMDWF